MTREEMWEEFESQLKSEVRTPITMSYDESIRLAEMGIRDVVARWKKRLEQEPKTGYWIDDKCSVCGKGTEDLIDSREWYQSEDPKYCPFCGVKLFDS